MGGRKIRPATESINGGHTVALGYDRDSLLTTAGELTIGRDPESGRITSIASTHAAHTFVERRTYDTFGALATLTFERDGTTIFAFAYTRDDLGRIETKTETERGVSKVFGYQYDLAGRLTDVEVDGVLAEHYEYDLNGNRLLGTNSAGTKPPPP